MCVYMYIAFSFCLATILDQNSDGLGYFLGHTLFVFGILIKLKRLAQKTKGSQYQKPISNGQQLQSLH